jgi:branched-chain amino acid transport system ATP-binding protein
LASEKKVLVVNNVYANYSTAKVLNGVSLDLAKGEITIILGTNGSGKSTLLKCMAGIVCPNSGNVTLSINGNTITLTGKKPYEIAELGVILVPEGRRLFRDLTVKENLLIGAYRKDARKNIRENLKIVYDLFPVLRERESQMAGTLSGGEQQMLVIAKGLMSNPRILLIDEPSQGLAPLLVRGVMEKIKELRDYYGLTILMSEQNFTQAIKIADRGYVLVHGKVEFEGKSSELANLDLVRKFYFA